MNYYTYANEEEYAVAVSAAKADCERALRHFCDNAEIAEIRYSEEEDDAVVTGGGARVTASVVVKMPNDKNIVLLSANDNGVDYISAYIYKDDGEIEISCTSYPLIDVSTEE